MSSFPPKLFYESLLNLGVNFYSGVPDSLLKSFCYFVNDNANKENHIIAANEGSALALALGHHLSTGEVPLVYLQNSGLGNLVNPLLSLTHNQIYSIPGILMIGWRGEPGIPDEPQHIKQGAITLDLLKIMDIPYKIFGSDMPKDQVISDLRTSVSKSKKENRIYAVVIKKNFFEKYNPKKESIPPFEMTRERAIELVASNCNPEDLIVSSTGLPSRELHEYRKKNKLDHSKDFMVVGGMGYANQIALGISISQPNRKIICLDGDGALIMHMGSLTTIGTSNQSNLLHIILNNGAHDSVGGQKTTALDINLSMIAKYAGYKNNFSVSSEKEVIEILSKNNELEGPSFLEIKIKKGWRTEIGRPTKSPKENKINFMLNLSKKESK